VRLPPINTHLHCTLCAVRCGRKLRLQVNSTKVWSQHNHSLVCACFSYAWAKAFGLEEYFYLESRWNGRKILISVHNPAQEPESNLIVSGQRCLYIKTLYTGWQHAWPAGGDSILIFPCCPVQALKWSLQLTTQFILRITPHASRNSFSGSN